MWKSDEYKTLCLSEVNVVVVLNKEVGEIYNHAVKKNLKMQFVSIMDFRVTCFLPKTKTYQIFITRDSLNLFSPSGSSFSSNVFQSSSVTLSMFFLKNKNYKHK